MNPGTSEIEPRPRTYEVRAHHLDTLNWFRAVGEEPFNDGLRRNCTSLNTDFEGRTYYTDVYGTSVADRQRTESERSEFLAGFWALEPDDTVAVVTARRDGLCRSCTFGNHCESGLEDWPSVEDRIDTDTETVRRFVNVAAQLGFGDMLLQRIEPTKLQSGAVIHSEVVETTAKVAQDVIKSHKFLFAKTPIDVERLSRTEKEWRAAHRRKRREELFHSTEYQRALGLHAVASLRPLIGAYCLYMAGSMLFTIGEVAQGVADADNTTHGHERHQLVEKVNHKITNLEEDGLLLLVAGGLYSAVPRTYRTRRKLQELTAERSAAVSEQLADS